MRDKYRSLGEEEFETKEKGNFWTIEEMVNMIRIIERKLKKKILLDKSEEIMKENQGEEVGLDESSQKKTKKWKTLHLKKCMVKT